MRKISSLDQKILNFKVEEIYKAILDFEYYNLWWPKEMKVKLIEKMASTIGSKIEITAYQGKFICELVKAVQHREIVVKYSGLHKGIGTWFFVEGANGVKVMYEVELEINNIFASLLSYILDFNSMHSKMMTKIFTALENYLKDKFNDKTTDHSCDGNIQSKIFTLPSN